MKSMSIRIISCFFILFTTLILFSCNEKNDGSQHQQRTPDDPIEIPSFAVAPMENNTGSTSSLTSLNNQGPPLIEIPDVILISCNSQIQFLGNTPVSGLITGRLGFMDYLNIFYALTNFYDCNIRHQAGQYGVEEESGQYVSSYIDEDNPEDNTRYVSWIYEDSENNNNQQPIIERIAKGKIVNLHLQENNIRTKIRINLSNSDGNRVVDNVIRFSAPRFDGGSGNFEFYIRVFFKEILNENNEVVEHRIGARYYSTVTNINDIFSIAAVVKKDVGSVVFIKRCDDIDDPHGDCSLSSSDVDSTLFYDTSGNDLGSAAPTGIPTTLEEIGTDYTSYLLNDFYSGQKEEDDDFDFFEPSFDPDAE